MSTLPQTTIHLRLPLELRQSLELIAEQQERTVSQLVRLVLKDYLEKLDEKAKL